ncbi:MAG: chemotaxis protein CheA, partial [Alphaproteobacteria bacterium]|nr:chemotaxis protein CheA [Alphaproteobacteria bacterium]
DAESILLEINVDSASLDDLNAIFRCAHSIKGGAGVFSMNNIVKFTPVVETLLDKLRDSKITLTKPIVDIVIRANDIITKMVEAARDNKELDDDFGAGVLEEVEAVLSAHGEGHGASKAASQAPKVNQAKPTSKFIKQYLIEFIPSPEMLRSGSEPFVLIKALSNLGIPNVRCKVENIPDFHDIDPISCYMSWEIDLETSCSDNDIADIFEFVSDVAKIKISQQSEIELPLSEEELKAHEAQSPEQEEGKASEDKTQQAAKDTSKDANKNAASSNTTTIRVDTDKIDKLVNMVGELVITQSMLYDQAKRLPMEYHGGILRAIEELSQHSRELQEAVMSVRMQPVKSLFSRMPRLIRDLAGQLGKDIKIEMSGEQTEIDKTVIEQLGDPLMHMIRNSCDHGIEKPQDRIAKGKPAQGSVSLSAANRGGRIIIEIKDDGAGITRDRVYKKALEKGLIDPTVQLSGEEIDNLVFLPGFSTAEVISNISGRGVGMDVVRRNIEGLGGSVVIKSEMGKGSVFTVSLPLTLAILDGMIIRVGEEQYIIPIENIVETLSIKHGEINEVTKGNQVVNIRGEFINIIELHKIFSVSAANDNGAATLVVLVESLNSKFGLVVDELLGQQQVVIKSLEENSNPIDGISGATILGDGKVSLILDISKIPTIHQKILVKENPIEKRLKIEEC